MSTLERAIAIAARAHAGQVDKGGAPYILHPLRVMLRLSEPREQLVAVLHDVIEDSPVTLEQLRGEGFSEEVLQALAGGRAGFNFEFSDFGWLQRGGLAGGAHDADAIGAFGDVPVDQLAQGGVVDAAVGVERGDEGNDAAGDGLHVLGLNQGRRRRSPDTG